MLGSSIEGDQCVFGELEGKRRGCTRVWGMVRRIWKRISITIWWGFYKSREPGIRHALYSGADTTSVFSSALAQLQALLYKYSNFI
jgi:hypothetical protein